MSQNMATPITPIHQIKKISIEIPCAPIKEKNQQVNINVEIPKFNINFDENDSLREHEIRRKRKTSCWDDDMPTISSDKK